MNIQYTKKYGQYYFSPPFQKKLVKRQFRNNIRTNQSPKTKIRLGFFPTNQQPTNQPTTPGGFHLLPRISKALVVAFPADRLGHVLPLVAGGIFPLVKRLNEYTWYIAGKKKSSVCNGYEPFSVRKCMWPYC